MAYAKIRPRRGTLFEWTSTNPVLAEGELVIEYPESGVGTGLSKFKIGDGYTAYQDLPYAFDAEAASAIYGGNVYEWNNIWVRTGTTEEWRSANPILGPGEIGHDISRHVIKIGDGVTPWNRLRYISGGSNTMFDDDYDFGDMDEEELEPEYDDYNFGDDDDPNDDTDWFY